MKCVECGQQMYVQPGYRFDQQRREIRVVVRCPCLSREYSQRARDVHDAGSRFDRLPMRQPMLGTGEHALFAEMPTSWSIERAWRTKS